MGECILSAAPPPPPPAPLLSILLLFCLLTFCFVYCFSPVMTHQDPLSPGNVTFFFFNLAFFCAQSALCAPVCTQRGTQTKTLALRACVHACVHACMALPSARRVFGEQISFDVDAAPKQYRFGN